MVVRPQPWMGAALLFALLFLLSCGPTHAGGSGTMASVGPTIASPIRGWSRPEAPGDSWGREVRLMRALIAVEGDAARASRALEEALASESSQLRDLACVVAVRLDRDEAIPALVQAAIDHRPARPSGPATAAHYRPASVAIAALAWFGERARPHLPRLLGLLQAEGPWLTPWLLPAICAMDPEGKLTGPSLRAGARHDDPFVRAASREALTTLRSP